MALPQKIQVNAITGASLPSSIDGDLNAGIKQPLIDIFGIPDNTNISAALLSVAATGLTAVVFRDAAGNPATAGHLQRNGANLLFHDGTAARILANETNTATLTNKTLDLTSNTLTGTTAQFNTALSDNDFATQAGAETLTNKTITAPVLSGTATGTYTLGGTPTISSTAAASGLTMNTARLLGRTTASAGVIEELTVAASLTLSGGALSGTAASETQAGVVELATQAEVNAMTDTTRALTPNHNTLVLGTPVATTSGTSFNFSSIPSDVRRVTINFAGVSLSGTDELLVQIGPSGGVETSGYAASAVRFSNTPGVSHASSTAAFIIRGGNAAYVTSGTLRLTLLNSATNLWAASGVFIHATNEDGFAGGHKALAGVLSQLTLKTDGANTFDAGSLNIMYER